jgi:hypothetical protein
MPGLGSALIDLDGKISRRRSSTTVHDPSSGAGGLLMILRGTWTRCTSYVLVDEFQHTNDAQREQDVREPDSRVDQACPNMHQDRPRSSKSAI